MVKIYPLIFIIYFRNKFTNISNQIVINKVIENNNFKGKLLYVIQN